jgi:hypothetical protein
MPTYEPPTVRVRKSRLHTIYEGVTVLRENGVWTCGRNFQQERIDAAERAYLGGRVYDLSQELFDEIPENVCDGGGGGGGEPT